MKNKFDELTPTTFQLVNTLAILKRFGYRLTAVVLFWLACSSGTQAQTSVVCDSLGDPSRSNGKANGSQVPPWLDISQCLVTTDSYGNILFTLTLGASVPIAPEWSGIEDGGHLTWSWRLLNNLADLTVVRNGCFGANGSAFPACYYLDLIWSVPASSFRARLLDNTSCTEVLVPFAFSADRTQITLVVAKNLLTNPSLIPNPDNFQFLAATVLWSSDSMENSSFHHLDWAPDLNDRQLVMCSWSALLNSSSSCP